MNKKESVIWEFEMDFKKSFCCNFNLSNDDIISVLCKHVMLHFVTNSRFENEYGFYRPGLKTGVENDIFCSEMRVRIWRTGRQSPTLRIPRSTPPPGLTAAYLLKLVSDQ